MENKEEVNPMSDAVKFGGGPEGFLVAARAVENPTNQIEVPTMAALQPVNLVVAAAPTSTLELKKKRGRPRKYGGLEGGTVTTALSPMPISASIPLSGGDFSGWKQLLPTKLKPFQGLKKPHKLDFQALAVKKIKKGEWSLCGGNLIYTSPEFPMIQVQSLLAMMIFTVTKVLPFSIILSFTCVDGNREKAQKFLLPEPVLCIGGIMQIELLGRIIMHPLDDMYYFCVSYVEAMGRDLSPEFDVEFIDKSGRVILKHNPDA